VLLAIVVVGFGLSSGTAQTGQDAAAETGSDERKFINTVPAHVPIKVKLKNEQSFKKKENKNWARELEIEVKNTGSKPIYYIYVIIELPDVVFGDGIPLGFRVKYGRPELAFLETPLEPADVPILPGESVTLKLHKGQVQGYEERRDKDKREDAKKVEFHMQIINFGDGTGFRSTQGNPDKAVKKSSATPRQKAKPGGCPPAASARSADSSGLLLKALYSLTPATFSRVNFSLPEAGTATA
jgi:hypothetical protein